MTIPNNPEIKSPSKLRYENPTVHAFLYMRKVFYETIRFVNRLSYCLLAPDRSERVASLGQNLKTPLQVGTSRQSGVKVASLGVIDDELRALYEKLLAER